ncbi:hypothetical protein K402DRAFT_399015 [Aulographum hederae CBS 113979]|uniref:Uncharacterized protein n=1 Tax=Aulographum hederae CBS 113979 TaxID=1176131 RepID=A0A6G1GJH9_9PEZI|nr:hypothetical protein K402DRAFT_399015 [Aulographum hederae CBS 113979]
MHMRCRQTLIHLVAYCPDLIDQRAQLIRAAGSTNLRAILANKDKAVFAAEWLLSTRVLAYFNTAMEVAATDGQQWAPFQEL